MTPNRYDRDELLLHTDLRALLDELCGPATAGSPRWRCPDATHDDLHPSVTVTTDRRGIERWRCWSGGHRGTAIDAVSAAHRIGTSDAFTELARRVGVKPDIPNERPIRLAPPPRQPKRLHPDAIRYVETCEQLLWKPIGRPVLNYLLDDRGLDAAVLRANRVGADPGTSRLRRVRGLPAGGPGAVFPALDANGVITYLQTRYINPNEQQAKYGNPVARLGDNPRHGWIQPVGPSKPAVVICEGIPDALTVAAAGYTAIAILGALNSTPALAENIADRIGTRPVIVAFDGDPAGVAASTTLTRTLTNRSTTVVELRLPLGDDFNSWVRAAKSVPEACPPTHASTRAAAIALTAVPELSP